MTWINTSGKVIVTDPCYKKDYADDKSGWRIAGTIDNVMKGKWNCAVKQETLDGWGKRNTVLMTWNSYQEFPNDDNWVKEDFVVGVDSGQAGIFDYQKYPKETGYYHDSDSFYKKCCNVTLKNGNGVIDHDGNIGVVSSSGIGDGTYNCLTHKNTAGKIDGIMLDFWSGFGNDSDSEETETPHKATGRFKEQDAL